MAVNGWLRVVGFRVMVRGFRVKKTGGGGGGGGVHGPCCPASGGAAGGKLLPLVVCWSVAVFMMQYKRS